MSGRFTRVAGGTASGKSEFAERLILESGPLPRHYIATMEIFDEECRARVARHRAMRATKGFSTVESPVNLPGALLPPGGAVLLECMTNLTANELFSPNGAGSAEAAEASILAGVDKILSTCARLVIVTGEVFSGGNQYAGDTDTYLRLLARVNRALAARADEVCEVVCGLPVWYKSENEVFV